MILAIVGAVLILLVIVEGVFICSDKIKRK